MILSILIFLTGIAAGLSLSALMYNLQKKETLHFPMIDKSIDLPLSKKIVDLLQQVLNDNHVIYLKHEKFKKILEEFLKKVERVESIKREDI